jgi:hypothetical protein
MTNHPQHNPLFSTIKQLIEESKQQVAVTVNATMSMLYWHVGKRINTEILGNERAEYGAQVIQLLSLQLSEQYGKGWSEKQLRHCMQFASVFDSETIVSTLWRQLSWSHFHPKVW